MGSLFVFLGTIFRYESGFLTEIKFCMYFFKLLYQIVNKI